ncbi:MAG: acyl-ACP--UDP-N-acetylglucosamine O-acyltransferase [Pseudomonadota bacterium]
MAARNAPASISVDPTARVDAEATLAPGVSIGAYSIIGPDVDIGANTRIGAHCVINGPTRIGTDNRIYQFNSLGDDPQDKKYADERTWLEIGDRNVIREYCTFNRGTVQGGGVTRLGDDNWVMAYVHLAHDCQVGSDTIMANGTTLAGHVEVGDWAVLGAFTVVHQFCQIGAHVNSAMGTVVLKDVPPFVTIAGNSASAHGINAEGLKRRGYDAGKVRALKRAYKTVYKQGLTLSEALDVLDEQAQSVPEVGLLTAFLKGSKRGIVR